MNASPVTSLANLRMDQTFEMESAARAQRLCDFFAQRGVDAEVFGDTVTAWGSYDELRMGFHDFLWDDVDPEVIARVHRQLEPRPGVRRRRQPKVRRIRPVEVAWGGFYLAVLWMILFTVRMTPGGTDLVDEAVVFVTGTILFTSGWAAFVINTAKAPANSAGIARYDDDQELRLPGNRYQLSKETHDGP